MTLAAVDPSVAKPGLLAFGVVAALGLVAFLLFRSMNNRIKNIHFDERGDEPRSGREADQGGGAPEDPGGSGPGPRRPPE